MSEETQNQEQEKKDCKCKLFAVLTIISLIFSIAALTTSIYALNGGIGEGSGKKVVISKQYDKGKSYAKALETNKPIIAFFYTDWCGFCQRFVKTFYKVSKDKRIKKTFAIAYVNCEKDENSALVKDFGVQGFPTVYVIDAQGNRTHLDNGTFFNDDSKETIIKNALEAIGQ